MDTSMQPWMRLKKELPAITEEIVGTYQEEGVGNHIASNPLPSRDEVVAIIADVLALVFPGYVGHQRLLWSNVRYYAGQKVDGLYERLVTQIWRAVRHECRRRGNICTHCEEQAERHAIAFLRGVPELRRELVEDVQAAHAGDPAAKSYDEIIFSYPGLRAIGTYRVAHRLFGLKIPLLPRIMTEWAHTQTGIDIHPGATIGRRFFIDHGTGVVIGETTVIGDDVKIYQGVTLGALSLEDVETMRGIKRHPTIEDDVVIYSNATILGDTVIGKGSVINGNVFLTKSIPPDTRVGFEAPKLHFRNAGPDDDATPDRDA